MAKSRASGAGVGGANAPSWFGRMKFESDYIKQLSQKAHYRKNGEIGYWNGDKIKYSGSRESSYGAEWESFTFLEGLRKGQKGTQMTMFDEVKQLNEDAKRNRLDREAKSRLQKAGGFNVKW